MTGDEAAIRRSFAAVCAELARDVQGLDPAEARRHAREIGIRSGFYGAAFPVESGGGGLPARIAVRLREDAAASGVDAARYLLAGPDGPAWLLEAGTDAQRATWQRPLVAGTLTRCVAMTEPDTGSALGSIATTATRCAAGWRIDGRKYLVSNAAAAEVAIVLANAVGPGRHGPTYFVFGTDTPGWRVGRELPGMHPGYQQYEVELAGVEVPDSAVLGGAALVGHGLAAAVEWLPYGRLGIAARAVGLATWALRIARGHARTRQLDGAPLENKQHIREFLVRSHVRIVASRALVAQAAEALDAGRIATLEAAVAKLHATETACAVIDDSMQVLGGRGWLAEFGLEAAYREARLFRVIDGTSEVQKETIFNLLPSESPEIGR